MSDTRTHLFGPVNANSRRTWAWATIFIVPLLFLAGQILILLPAKLLGLISRENVETYPQVLYLIIGSFAMVALLFTLWIWLFERRNLASVGLQVDSSSATSYFSGFGFGLLMAAAVVYGIRFLGGYDVEADVGPGISKLMPIAILLFAFVLQAGTEEMVFRGWMMTRIAERYGLWGGVVGNSVLFSLMHVDTDHLSELGIEGVVIFTTATLLFSVFLSLLVIHQKSIWGAAAWHAAWNWIFITWFGLPTTGIDLGLEPLISDYMPAANAPVWLTGGTDGPEGSVLTPLVLAIACLVLIRLLKQSKTTR